MENKWKSHRLGDICSLIKRGISPKYVEEGGVCVINQKCIRDQRLSFEQSRRNNSKLRKISDERYLRIGDMLVNSTGVGTLGRVARVKDLPEPTTVDSHVTILRPASKEIDSDYFSWAIRYNQPLFERLGEGSTGQTELSRRRVEDVVISAPRNITEQKAIAHILGSLDDKIELNRRMNETLEAMAQALFKSWFVDFDPVIDNALAAGNDIPEELKERAEVREAIGDARKPLPEEIQNLFPSEFEHTEEMGWIPKGWKVSAVESVIEINPTVKLPKNTVAPFVDMKALPTTGYSVGEIIEKPYAGGAKFQNGDVLLARITPCLENGKTAIADFLNGDQIGFGSTEFIILRGQGFVGTPFVACLSRNGKFRDHCIQSMVGSSGRQRVQNACFSNFFLSLPKEHDLLKEFNSRTEGSFNKITKHSEQSRVLTNLRDTLLPQLLSGEMRIPEAEKLVEDLERNGGGNGKS